MRSESSSPRSAQDGPPPGAAPGLPTAPGQPAGASIHNIGYRSYDGARLGRSYARLSLFAQSLRGAYGLGRSGKSKVLPMILFGVMCVPALIMVAVAIFTDAKQLPLKYTDYPLYMMPLIGLFIASTAPQLISRDLRFHTVPLYFSRPIERADYVLAKYGAMTGALLVFLGVPLVVLYAGGLLAELGFAEQTKQFALGLVLAVVFAVVHAGLGLLVAALTPRRGFGVAAIIAVLTIPYFAVTTVQFIAYQQNALEAVGWLGLASPGTLMSGLQSKFLDGTSDFPDALVPGDAAGVCYLLVTAVLIAGSYFLLLRRFRKAGL
ncbi:ABC transporter permease subunit [Streptomyces sp. 549]|uniref:ABC transporter permease n=1 Tax=Streptomyces sp. 549 TaxID=3049076 RepID=UPI0024C33DF9|nr:ABC transporter permease subunit [Streptomyces sp. 549]MDK1474993.1 ABC transporter permease subunit [Streptomyces sp. 549]